MARAGGQTERRAAAATEVAGADENVKLHLSPTHTHTHRCTYKHTHMLEEGFRETFGSCFCEGFRKES